MRLGLRRKWCAPTGPFKLPRGEWLQARSDFYREQYNNLVSDLTLPADFEAVIDDAWQRAHAVPGYIGELEFRALGLLAAGAPGPGLVVEIGSFEGKSAVGLAAIAARYEFGPLVSIDPHTAPSVTDPMLGVQ